MQNSLNSACLHVTQWLSTFSLPWWTVMLFLRVDQLPALSPLSFPCCKTLPRVPSMWGFFPKSVLLEYHHLFFTTVFPTLPSLNPLSVSIVLNGGKADFPTVGHLSTSSPVFSVITLHFLSAFSFLLADSLLRLSIFAKCHVGLLLGDKGGQLSTCSLSSCKCNRWAVTNIRDRRWKNWCGESPMIGPSVFMQWFVHQSVYFV